MIAAGLLAFGVGMSGGCTGVLGDSSDPAGSAGCQDCEPVAPELAAGPMPLRRLSRREYNNTVRDLLGNDSRPADKFPDDKEDKFLFRRAGPVTTLDATVLRDAAEALASSVNVDALLPCDPNAAGEEACAKQFVETFGLRANRRPLVADETGRLMDLYKTGRTTLALDFPGAVKLLVEAMLQSSGFIYRWELGPSAKEMEGPVVRLGPYENASRLSYFLWRSMPDQELLDAAAANHLGTAAEMEAQARRMLDDPKAHDTVSSFFEEWLNLDQVADRPKDLGVYPEYTDDLKAAMTAETKAFIDNVIFQGDGRLQTLLTATFSFTNEPLAALYGSGNGQGDTLQRTDLDPAERSGLLTQAGFLTVSGATNGSHPVKRGRKVVERLLCKVLPPPPNNVPPPKPPSEGGTTRQRFAEHSQQECAKSCHSIMDPVGFAFEHYDGIGRYRTEDNGLPVDASGSITIDGGEKSFKDAVELTHVLAESQEARDCFVTQWARFAFDRADTPADTASLKSAAAVFSRGGDSVRELLVGVATSRSFLYRSPASGEM